MEWLRNKAAIRVMTVLVLIPGALILATRFGISGEVKPAAHSRAYGAEPIAPVVAISPSSEDSCPLQTSEEWQQFLDRAIEKPNWVETCEDSECDTQFYNFVKKNVADTFAACGKFIAQHPAIASCTDRFRRYTPTWLAQHSPDTYGFTVDNHVYLTRQDADDKPENMMKIPDAIVEALPDRDRVEAAARLNGWHYLTHDSALGGFRTFVVVGDPKGRFDQWMLLNLRDGKNQITNGTPLSILVVQKKTKDGHELPQVKLHFRDYVIEHLPHEKYRVALNETINGKCYSCHSNGVRQLIARNSPILEAQPVKGEAGYSERPAPSRAFGYTRLMEFNRRLRSYGRPDWEGYVIPANHGPAIGKMQGCMDCHDGKSRAELNISTSVAQLEQKVVDEMSMPPDSDLVRRLERLEMKNPALTPLESARFERAHQIHMGLLQDFKNSRYPALKEWLLETRCR